MVDLNIASQFSQTCRVIPVFKNTDIQDVFKQLELPNSIAQQAQAFHFSGQVGQILPCNYEQEKIILLGLGALEQPLARNIEKAFEQLAKTFNEWQISSFDLLVDGIDDEHITTIVQYISQHIVNGLYVFDCLKSEKQQSYVKQVTLITAQADNPELEQSMQLGRAMGIGQSYAKDLKNLPANICTTQYMFDQAKTMANDQAHCQFSYVDKEQMEKLGMGCLLGVAQGSDSPAYIANIEYQGAKTDEKPIVLVGKGLVFDSGGLCLKPRDSMGSMKMDMGGAAGVLGTMRAIMELQLPINVVGTVVLVENVIGSKAYRPSDVLTSMNGTTVEVGNTDAEGRLALCDTLTYIEKYQPKQVVDVATLTGAIIVGLGNDLNGLMGNHQAFIDTLLDSGKQTGDYGWQLPLHEPYFELMKSDVADTNNIGGMPAGSITAGLFLSRFTKKYQWAHIDVAGTAMGDFQKSKATGRPVPMLTHYIATQANS